MRKGEGTLASPLEEGKALTGPGRGRRKRPLPPHPPPPLSRLCWRMTVGVQRGGFGPSRATTRDRPYHAPKHCSGPFVHGRGDPLWSPSLGRTLLSTRAVIRQQSLYSARNLLIPTRPSSRRTWRTQACTHMQGSDGQSLPIGQRNPPIESESQASKLTCS